MFLLLSHHLFMAATSVKTSTDTNFFNEGIGLTIQKLSSIMAIFVVIFGLFAMGKAVVGGRAGTAVKSLLGTIVLGAFMLNLQLIPTIINWGTSVVGGLMDTFGKAF